MRRALSPVASSLPLSLSLSHPERPLTNVVCRRRAGEIALVVDDLARSRAIAELHGATPDADGVLTDPDGYTLRLCAA